MGYAELNVGLEALVGLLSEFGKGNIVDPRAERGGLLPPLEKGLRLCSPRTDRFPVLLLPPSLVGMACLETIPFRESRGGDVEIHPMSALRLRPATAAY